MSVAGLVGAVALMAGCASSAASPVDPGPSGPGSVAATSDPASPSGEAPSAEQPASASPATSVTATAPSVAPAGPAPTALPGQPLSADYVPGARAVVSVPVKEGPNPLLVIVPGGGWKSSNPGYMGPLISAFDTWGLTTATLGYGGTESGAVFPVPVEQLTCGVRWAAAVATASGRPPTTVTVLGHSAGAHLGALVALAGDAFAAECPWPPVPIDAFVGLAGLYDPTEPGDLAAAAALPAFFGTPAAADPALWERGSPVALAAQGVPEGLSIFLLHGVDDDALPVDGSRRFADALRAAGADVTMVDWPGGHWDVLDPATVVPPLYTWIVDPARG